MLTECIAITMQINLPDHIISHKHIHQMKSTHNLKTSPRDPLALVNKVALSWQL